VLLDTSLVSTLQPQSHYLFLLGSQRVEINPDWCGYLIGLIPDTNRLFEVQTAHLYRSGT